MNRVRCEVAVIGAGPAGLAAAVGAHEAGARDIVIIERDRQPGGILQQCIHTGFGLSLLREDLTGPEYAQRYIARADELGIRCLTDTMVIDLSPSREITAVSPEGGLVRMVPGAVVLAMGCRERTRGALALPGTRPAGIMTAGAAQRFINIDGQLPGRRIVILGSGDIGMIMARRLHLEGCAVEAVVEYQSTVGGLTRNLVRCIQDFGIPLYLRHTVTDVRGSERITGVDICPLDSTGAPESARARSISCDTLLLSVGLIPENELSRRAGIELDERTGGPVVDELFRTSLPGVFAAGNTLQVYDLVDDVTRCALAAGAAAARFCADPEASAAPRAPLAVRPGQGVRSVVPQRIAAGRSAPVEFHLRASIAARKRDLELYDAGRRSVFRRRCSVIRPAEMVRVTVDGLDGATAGPLTFDIGGGTGGT